MSTRLDHVLNGLKEKGRKGLIIYLTAGMPDAEGTIDAVRRAEELQKEKMASVTAGMPLPPGMKFPF